jgi:hypothetical protein
VINEGSLTTQDLNSIASEIEAQVESLIRADQRLADASTAWCACMAKDAYTFADPHVAFASFAQFADGLLGGS